MQYVTESGMVLPVGPDAPPPFGSGSPDSSLSRTPVDTRLQVPLWSLLSISPGS
jgi:hypothetical protein